MADVADGQIPQNVDSEKMRVFLKGIETYQHSAEKMFTELDRLIRTNINRDNILDGINNQLNDWNEEGVRPVPQSVIKEIAKSIEEFDIYDGERVRSVMLREMERVRIDGLCLESIPGIGPKAAETLRHTFGIDTVRVLIDKYNTPSDDFETLMIKVHGRRPHFAAKTTQAMVSYMAKVLDGSCDPLKEMADLAGEMYDAGEITRELIENMRGKLGNMVRASRPNN